MNAVIEKLPQLVTEELAAANALHEHFHSPHEGYAVLLEEVEEAKEQLARVGLNIECLWAQVRNDRIDNARRYAKSVETCAVRLAAEAIQVAAMAQKFMEVTSA